MSRSAERWYRRLLLLLPFDFRREFGAEMTDVFIEQRRAVRNGGLMSRVRLWFATITGLVRLGPREHLSVLRQDVAFAWRLMRRAPTFTMAAVLALGIGVGANAAVFGLVNAVLLNPLPIPEPHRVASIQLLERKDGSFTPVSTGNFLDVRERQDVFEGVAAYSLADVRLEKADTPDDLLAMVVSGGYFQILGLQAAVGRLLLPHEDVARGGSPVAVLSHRLWSRAFGREPGVVGRTMRLSGHPFTVVGVAPESFRGTAGFVEPDLYVPFGMYGTLVPDTPWFEGRLWRWLNLLARLKPGVTIEQADASLRIIGDHLAEEHPRFNTGRTLAVLPLERTLVGANDFPTYARAGWLLTGVVAVVLLIACANLANLLLARSMVRAREIALRVALGASRGRLVRQLLTESVLLGLAGGGVGLLFAHWTHEWLWASRPAALAQPAIAVGLNGTVLLFALIVSVAGGLLFGLVPALQVSRTDVNAALKAGGRQPALGGRARFRTGLVVAEVALSMVALAAAGLFVRSLQQAQQIDPGFQTDGVASMQYNPGAAYDRAEGLTLHRQVLARIAGLPGVRSAAIASTGLLQQGPSQTIGVTGHEPPAGSLGFLVPTNTVTPGYFETLGIPLVRGRAFARTDDERGRPVAVINETMARRFWPDRDPVGQRFTSRGMDEALEIVGVARDIKYATLGEAPQPFFYLPLLQRWQPGGGVALFVAAADEGAVVAAARGTLRELDPAITLTDAGAPAEAIAQALWAPRTVATLVSAFGVLALLLAAVGIYGVMAFTVSQRTQEIGLRMALGAGPGKILASVLGHGFGVAALGVVLGGAGALGAAGTIGSLLYGIEPRDPLTFAAVALLLVSVALVACYVPARRAARVDPAVSLRG